MKEQRKITAWIVPETHWDREWIMTQGQFQVRLANLLDRLLDICESDPEYRFYFDGQTIALEDYLEICPGNRSRLQRLLKNKQLAAGPWFVLADQFMQGGEAAIRNLLEGMRSCRELGGMPVMLGYVPDSFGSSSALPMLLNEFAIRYAIFGRGRATDKFPKPYNEFKWQSSDGSSVIAANFFYSGGLFLSYPDIYCDIRKCQPEPQSALRQFMEAAEKQRINAMGKDLYFPVGVDHMEPRESLPSIVRHINAKQHKYLLKFGVPDDYMKGVEKTAGRLAVYRGEQCGTEKSPMKLTGTLSSHVELKQSNFRCEKILTGAVEPMSLMASKFSGHGYPTGILRKMWKLLLANQAHDSICGCSIDQVHRDMMSRYDFIENTSAYLIKNAAEALVRSLDTSGHGPDVPSITVFNPLCGRRNAAVHSLISIPGRFEHRNYSLVDESGNIVPAAVTKVANKKMDLESIYMMPEQLAVLISKEADETCPVDQVFTVLDVDFVAPELPMCGWKTFWLIPEEKKLAPELQTTEFSMKNEFLEIKILPDGSFDITDLRSKRRYKKVLSFEDFGDAGNLYDLVPLPEDSGFSSKGAKAEISLLEALPHRGTFRITIPFFIPARLKNKKERSRRMVKMPLTVYVYLYSGIPRVELRIELENPAENHCLQAVFSTGLKARTAESDVNFDVVSRPLDSDKKWHFRPMQNFMDVSDGKHGLCIMTKGLYSQQATKADDGSVNGHITLLRCTGHLGPAAGADYPTPAGQCPGRHVFEMAIQPHSGDWQSGQCASENAAFSNPVCLATSWAHAGKLPCSANAISVDNPGVISCFKQSETGGKTVLRCWNPNDSAMEMNLSGLLMSDSVPIPVHADETPISEGTDTLLARGRGLFSVMI